MKEKAFFQALAELHKKPKVLNKFLKDKRLTQTEKKIISGWGMLRKGKNVEVMQLTQELQADSPDVEMQRKLLLGIAYNNQGLFAESIQELLAVVDYLMQRGMAIYPFISAYNLFIASYNFVDPVHMQIAMRAMDQISDKTDSQVLSWKLCRFMWHSYTKEYNEAQSFYDQIETQKSEMSESTVSCYLISKFVYQIKRDRFSDAWTTLDEMKEYRSYRMSANFKFMKTLLGFITQDSSLYVYEKDYKECMFLFYQLAVIQGLQEGDLGKAQHYWDILQNLQPELYLANFQFSGEKCLFSLSLEKFSSDEAEEPTLPELPEDPYMALDIIFENYSTPIPKERVFELLYGRKPSSEVDDNKLRNLLYAYRKKTKHEIQYKKGCYSKKAA
jgi:hypothetical protein